MPSLFKVFFFLFSFCSQLICSETIVNYISGNFVVWAWDMTHNSNRARCVYKLFHLFYRDIAGDPELERQWLHLHPSGSQLLQCKLRIILVPCAASCFK